MLTRSLNRLHDILIISLFLNACQKSNYSGDFNEQQSIYGKNCDMNVVE
jgi:hypothetical protein